MGGTTISEEGMRVWRVLQKVGVENWSLRRPEEEEEEDPGGQIRILTAGPDPNADEGHTYALREVRPAEKRRRYNR